ncbi:MAG: hypothetical protein RLZZ240_704, partial [Actinomycetota bacterium]
FDPSSLNGRFGINQSSIKIEQKTNVTHVISLFRLLVMRTLLYLTTLIYIVKTKGELCFQVPH